MNKSKRDELAEKYRGKDYNSTGSCKQQGFIDGYSAGFADAKAQAKVLVEALEECHEHSKALLENIHHYFNNRCIPTHEEVGNFMMLEQDLRRLLKQYRKAVSGE